MKYTILALLCSINCMAQQKPIEKIAANCSTASLKKNLYFLASDAMEGRMMGSRGDTMAAKFVSDWFKKNKLEMPFEGGKSYYQSITALRQEDKSALTINNKAYEILDGWQLYPDAPVNLSSLPVLYTDYTDIKTFCNDLPKMDVKGKAIFWTQNMYFGITLAQMDSVEAVLKTADVKLVIWSGPSATKIIERRKANNFLPKYKLPPYFEGNTNEIMPEVTLTPARWQELAGADSTTENPGHAHFYNLKRTVSVLVEREYRQTNAPNIIGIIRGTDTTKSCVVISAHHDHDGKNGNTVYFGAVDNASGTVALMEMAAMANEALKEGLRPQRTIVFASFTGEERGLLGSQWYVDHPAIPMEKTFAVFNIDMFGRTDTLHIRDKKADSVNYAYILVKDPKNAGLREVLFNANDSFGKLTLDPYYENPKYEQRRLMGSDQYPFYLHGVPFIRIDCGFAKDYHKPTDTPDKINYGLLTKQTQLAFLTLWGLANK